jgi:hypothetical protein
MEVREHRFNAAALLRTPVGLSHFTRGCGHLLHLTLRIGRDVQYADDGTDDGPLAAADRGTAEHDGDDHVELEAGA